MSYTDQQTAIIRTIIAEGQRLGEAPSAIVGAISTAMVESNFQNYANSNSSASLAIGHDAVGSDHGSLGVFQQQSGQVSGSTANWGTVAQLMDPATAADKFYQAWDAKIGKGVNIDTADIGAADQKIQGSQYPDRYQKVVDQSATILKQVSLGKLLATVPGVQDPVTSVATSTDAGQSISRVLGTITKDVSSPAWWTRVGVVFAGLVILLIAVKMLADGESNPAHVAPSVVSTPPLSGVVS